MTEEGDRLGDGRMGEQMGLDFTGFDAEAAQLDLLIDAAMEGEGAIGIPGSEITGSIEASGGAG